MRNLFNRFRCAKNLQTFIAKSNFDIEDIEKHFAIARKMSRKYLCIIVGEDGSEVLFSFSYRNRLMNIVKYFCGGEYDDNKIKSIHYFDTVITEEDIEEEED